MRIISALILLQYFARTWQSEEATAATAITFQPGPIGIDVWPKGTPGPKYVVDVVKGSQAEKAGVQIGWTFMKIGNSNSNSTSVSKAAKSNSSYDISFYQVNATRAARTLARRYQAFAYLRDMVFPKTRRQRREEELLTSNVTAEDTSNVTEKKAAAKAAIAKFRTARKDARREQYEAGAQERLSRKVNYTKYKGTYTRGEIKAFRAEAAAPANMTKLEKLLDALTIRAAGDARSYNARTSQHGPSFAARGAFRNQMTKDSLDPYVQHILMQRALQIAKPFAPEMYGHVKIEGARLVDRVNPYYPNGNNTVDMHTSPPSNGNLDLPTVQGVAGTPSGHVRGRRIHQKGWLVSLGFPFLPKTIATETTGTVDSTTAGKSGRPS